MTNEKDMLPESILDRLEFFANGFERLAKTSKQHALADEFMAFVQDVNVEPLGRADLEPMLTWLDAYADGFNRIARTPEQKELVAEFQQFIREVHDLEREAASPTAAFTPTDSHFDTGRQVNDKPTPPGTVHFHGFDCEVEQRTYANGRMALVLVNTKDREEVAVATVNLPEAPLKPGEVFIKDYSENEGMLAALEKAGIVKATGDTVRSGFVEVAVAKVLSPTHRRDRQDDLNIARANESSAEKIPTNRMPGATDTYRQMLAEAASAAPKRDKDKDIER